MIKVYNFYYILLFLVFLFYIGIIKATLSGTVKDSLTPKKENGREGTTAVSTSTSADIHRVLGLPIPNLLREIVMYMSFFISVLKNETFNE